MKICFLSLNSYPMLTGKNLGYAGGAEVEQAHLGKELAAQGYDVCFVTYHHNHNNVENVDGIKILKTYERKKTSEIPVFLKYKFIWSSLRKANADIYFHEAGSTGILPMFCCMTKKKFVYRIPSDLIVLGKPPLINDLKQRIVHNLEIKRADAIIAQSDFQKRILKERFRMDSVVIKNGMPLPKVNYEKSSPPFVLWVGSISNSKHPDRFLELAKSMPNVRFEMIGGKTRDRKIYEYIERAAKRIPNFTFHGFVPYPKINEYFKRASIFVNTSDIEGFPNTFIQAWSHYTPVVSFNFDPDKIIQKEKLGLCSGGVLKQFASDVTTLIENEKLRKTMGKNGRKYVEREHDIRKVVKIYIYTFNKIL